MDSTIAMKAKIILLALLIPLGALAFVTVQFPGWDALTENSSDIIVARCVNVQDPYNSRDKDGHLIDFRALVSADFEIVSVLKGTKNSGIVRMSSQYWPQQGCNYLLFKTFSDGAYYGLESYRVVPLGVPFITNSIAGKPLNDQLQILFKRARRKLEGEIQNDQEQISRLDEAIQK